MTKFAVVGADGQLGSDLMLVLADAGHDPLPLAHADIEVTDPDSVERALGAAAADVVVNTAALNVEESERDPGRAFAVNAIGCRNLVVATAARGASLVHISTDYVFDGGRREPYTEEDCPRPVNAYGISKLAGEHFVLATGGPNTVIRTSGLYGVAGCRAKGGKNFVTMMLELAGERDNLAVVDDEVMTPTYTADLARQILTIHEVGLTGVVHATSAGGCSWYEFTRAIVELAGLQMTVKPTTASDFAAKSAVPVTRPPYSVLENRRLAEAGIDQMPGWRDALVRYLGQLQPTRAGLDL